MVDMNVNTRMTGNCLLFNRKNSPKEPDLSPSNEDFMAGEIQILKE